MLKNTFLVITHIGVNASPCDWFGIHRCLRTIFSFNLRESPGTGRPTELQAMELADYKPRGGQADETAHRVEDR